MVSNNQQFPDVVLKDSSLAYLIASLWESSTESLAETIYEAAEVRKLYKFWSLEGKIKPSGLGHTHFQVKCK